MSNDNSNIYVNIKELPIIEQATPGDLLIVETNTGTSIIDFENFILTPDNTTFYSDIVQNTTNINTVSANVNSLSSFINTVSANSYGYTRSVSSQLTTLIRQVSSDQDTNLEVVSGQLTTNLVTFTAAALLPFAYVSYKDNVATPVTIINCSQSTTIKSRSIDITVDFTNSVNSSNYITNISFQHSTPLYIQSLVKNLDTLNITLSTLSATHSFDETDFSCDIVCLYSNQNG